MRNRPSFELKRFTWAAPDRLDLSGTFTGLDDGPAGEPALVLDGAAGVHKLAAVAGSVSGSPARDWEAAFAWQEAPEAFERARLEFANGIRLELPQPAAKRPLRRQVIEVELPAGAGAEPVAEEPVAVTDKLRLQAALLAAEETAREAQAAARQAATELTRAREDLASERKARADDAERFRSLLEDFQATAAEAVAAEQAARRETESQLDPLRERIASLEQAGAEAERLRGALEAAESQSQAARAEVAASRAALNEARADAEQLLRHLIPGDEGAARE